MDHSNAQSTFVELAFGINTLFAIYRQFRDRICLQLRSRVQEAEAAIKSIESKNADGNRVSFIVSQISEIARKHIDFQDKMTPPVTQWALWTSVFCVLVAYFDWFEMFGFLNAILILPLPTYVVVSHLNLRTFQFCCWRKLRRFRQFRTEFEPPAALPPPPPPPAAGVKSDPDWKDAVATKQVSTAIRDILVSADAMDFTIERKAGRVNVAIHSVVLKAAQDQIVIEFGRLQSSSGCVIGWTFASSAPEN